MKLDFVPLQRFGETGVQGTSCSSVSSASQPWRKTSMPAQSCKTPCLLPQSSEDLMNSEISTREMPEMDSHVQEVIRAAELELLALLQQREELMKRIGSVKQTLSGLANMFGDAVLNERLLRLLD